MEKETIEQIKEAAASKFAEKTESLKNELSNEQKEKLETLKSEMSETFNTEIEKAAKLEDVEAVKGKVDELSEKLKNMDDSLMEVTKNNQKFETNMVNVKKEFKESLEKAIDERGGHENYASQKQSLRLTVKAAVDTLDVHTVGTISDTVYPDNGTVSAVSDVWRNRVAQLIGTYTRPRPFAKVMDYVNFRPLTSDRLLVFNLNIRGQFEVTPECAVKPVVYINANEQTADAEAVAGVFYTTTKIRRFYPTVVSQFTDELEKLLMEGIPNAVAAEISNAATPFTPAAIQAQYTNPNNYDVIAQIAASMKKLEFTPDTVFISPYQYANMITTKANGSGEYTLSNGMSVIIVNENTIKLGNINLTVIEDPTIEDDTVRVADLRGSVYVGVDENTIYLETDGVTDLAHQAGSGEHVTGAVRNVRTHVLEKYVATIIPDEMAGAVVETTFTQAKSLLTA